MSCHYYALRFIRRSWGGAYLGLISTCYCFLCRISMRYGFIFTISHWRHFIFHIRAAAIAAAYFLARGRTGDAAITMRYAFSLHYREIYFRGFAIKSVFIISTGRHEVVSGYRRDAFDRAMPERSPPSSSLLMPLDGKFQEVSIRLRRTGRSLCPFVSAYGTDFRSFSLFIVSASLAR